MHGMKREGSRRNSLLGAPMGPHLYFGEQSREGRLSRSSVESVGRSFEMHSVEEAVEKAGNRVGGGHDEGRVDSPIAGLSRNAGTMVLPSAFGELVAAA